jgi:hypothetical protein
MKHNQGRYWCRKKKEAVQRAKVYEVCLVRGCPHLTHQARPIRNRRRTRR